MRDYAYVRVHYRDGSNATLPIRTQREVPGLSGQDESTPIGWVRGDYLRLVGLSRQELTSNPRLPNPHPEKRIVSLDLEAASAGWSNPNKTTGSSFCLMCLYCKVVLHMRISKNLPLCALATNSERTQDNHRQSKDK